jgi:hypothetical protein
MNNFNFGEVLTRAWQNIWKHKVLWIFGILASCARGGGGSSGGGGNRSYQTQPGGNIPFSGEEAQRIFSRITQFFDKHIWIIVAAVLFIILLSVVFYALGMMGRIGLIKGTAKAETGAASLSFGEIWSESMPYFWRIFGLNFLIGLSFLIIFIPLILFGVITAGVGFLCIIPLICVLVPLSWVVALILEQAQAAIVIEDIGMLEGFKRGWQILKTNVGPMLIMAIILGVGSLILGLIIAVPLLLAFIPVFVKMETLRESLTPLYISLACCAVYLPVLIFFNGVMTAYIQSAWTLTYLRLAKPREDTPVFVEANA